MMKVATSIFVDYSLKDVLNVKVSGGGKGLDVRFDRQREIKGYPEAAYLWDWGKCGAINCN